MEQQQKTKEQTIQRVFHSSTALQAREKGPVENPTRVISGYAILFNTPSAVLYKDEDSEIREVIAPSAITLDLLNANDIKMTMFHNRQLILARSKQGKGTLSYSVDEKGVKFEFEVPHTEDGKKALELVSRGDIDGCSFIFTTHYYDDDFVERSVNYIDGKTQILYTVKAVTGVYDFTITDSPAYPDTSVESREFGKQLLSSGNDSPKAENEIKENVLSQVKEMRETANKKITLI